MWSFIISLIVLVMGYFVYGSFVDKVFGPDPSKPTPAVAKQDGVDFIPMPTWKVFMIQFLNIAGTGPIFGAIMGAKFGPSCYLWIVFGCIFAGAVHDYMSGMLSIRSGGLSVPNMVGKILGKGSMHVMLVMSIVLLLLVGTVFVYSPALILGDIAGDGTSQSVMFWVFVVFTYYVIATLQPVDKIIGHIYPLFAFALLFMAVGLMVCLFIKWPAIPELWDGLQNRGPSIGMDDQDIFPCLFITVACGALSGFHSTQSPIMARCLKNEKMGRPVFYGAMITEGIVALVWAAVSSYFYFDGGAAAVGSDLTAAAPAVVTKVSSNWLGMFGGILAVLGVVAAPITSGDTAFRSARLIIADSIHLDQVKNVNRIIIAVPFFLISVLLLWFNISNEDGFNIIWRYFGWANQSLATIALWAIAVYLMTRKKGAYYLIAMIPAAFMTVVVISYICMAKIGFHISYNVSIIIGVAVALLQTVIFARARHIIRKKGRVDLLA